MEDSSKSIMTKHKFDTYLNIMFQTLILTFAKNHSEDKVAPTNTSQNFFEQNNPSEAKLFLYHKLNLELNLKMYIPSGISTAIHIDVLF